MLAFSPEWINMGELRGAGYGHNEMGHLDLCGVAGLSVFYLSLQRAVDVLMAHESIDPQRIAVTGLSGGGWQTILISALDTRVTLSAPNAGYLGVATRIDHRSDIGDHEQNPTDLCAIADYVHLTAMLAPRPALLIYNEKDECCFPTHRAVASVFDPIVPVYELLGAKGRFAFHNNREPGTHNYLEDNRQAFYRFINRAWLPGAQGNDAD
jgi:hypothetical protein